MKTGRYVAVGGRWVKISDDARILPSIYWKEGGYFDVSARRYFHTKEEKRDWMRQHNLVELTGDDDLRDNPFRGLAEAGPGKRHTRKVRVTERRTYGT